MPVQADGKLKIFALNVAQADSTVVVTPEGRIVVIDAARPSKLCALLADLGLKKLPDNGQDEIHELILTHPHVDHFSGASRLLKEFKVGGVILAPFWNKYGLGPPSYRNMVNTIEKKKITVDFVSGYSRSYPDGASMVGPAGDAEVDPDAFYLEFLGPPNNLVEGLQRGGELDTNHLSIMTRLTWRKFRMIISADAQMENWSYFDQEGMLEQECSVLRSAHHGSCNGTQWERLERLSPECVIVSSDPTKQHGLPDLIGTAIFAKYSVAKPTGNQDKLAAITSETGTILVTVPQQGKYSIECFNDRPDDKIDLDSPHVIDSASNAAVWKTLLEDRAQAYYG